MTDPTMTSEKRGFLEQLLKAAVGKMEFGQEVEWEMSIVGEEDEDQLLFEELRKVSRTFIRVERKEGEKIDGFSFSIEKSR